MRRLWLALLLVLLTAAPAAAHGLNLTALVGYQAPDRLTLQVVDVYQSPLEGLTVTAQDATGLKAALAETAPGLYTGRLPGAAGRITVEFTVAGDLFRAVTEAGGTQDRPAEPVALRQFERGAKVWIEPVIFGGAVVSMLAVLGFALLRRA